MSLTNKEMQLQKNCRLYMYVLRSQGKEVPELIEECAHTHDMDYPVNCIAELVSEIEGLDGDTFDRIVNNSESEEAKELAYWWEMHQEAVRLRKEIAQTCL